MSITRKDRLNRALKYLEDEKWHAEQEMEKLEDIRLQEIIIIRNKKRMYMAEVEAMIRKIKGELEDIEKGAIV